MEYILKLDGISESVYTSLLVVGGPKLENEYVKSFMVSILYLE